MQPRIQLSIPQPCHEDWHKMTPVDKGRFCNACAKQVVDFTTMSDTEVLHYFLNKQGENVCGRMYPDQLNRPVTKPVYPVKTKWWQWNYAAMFLLFLSKSFSAKAQGAVKIIKTEQVPRVNIVELRATVGMVSYKAAVLKTITGNIADENGEPIAFASVQVKGSTAGTSADAKGHYSIKANTVTDVLIVSAVGYEAKTLILKNQKSFDVELATSKATLEGDIVVTVGAISSSNDYYTPSNPKHIAVIEVLDNATHQPVKATLTFNKTGNRHDTATTDTKGVYKLKHIKEDERFSVAIQAEGYLTTAVEIKGWAFNERKETRYVFLEKAPVLADYKQMDAVSVTNYGATVGKVVMGSVSQFEKCTNQPLVLKSNFTDTLNQLKTKLTGSLKIAPNPVQRGNAITAVYTLKQTGNYLLQIVNAAGQVVQQQQITAVQKNNSIQIQTQAAWSSGVYFLRVVNEKNNLLSTNSFIVK